MKRLLPVLLATGALLFAACGDDSGSSTATTASGGAATTAGGGAATTAAGECDDRSGRHRSEHQHPEAG